MAIESAPPRTQKSLNQNGFTLIELTIALVMSGIVLAGIFVVVSGSHSYVLKERAKINLQQDFSLIDQVLARNIREGYFNQQEIYASYADYTASASPQSTGTCLKLYFSTGDSTIIYKDGSNFKIQKKDLSVTNLVQETLDSIRFDTGTRSILTYLKLAQQGKTLGGDLVHTFRNIAQSVATDTLRPIGNGAFTEIGESDCSNNWECVDEVVSDDGATRVRERTGAVKKDTYLTSDGTSTGPIDSVVVYMRVREDDDNAKGRTAIHTNGATYYGTLVDLDGVTSYVNKSTTYVTNPNTSMAWTSSEIDAIQIGIRLYEARCTQVWAIIYYSN